MRRSITMSLRCWHGLQIPPISLQSSICGMCWTNDPWGPSQLTGLTGPVATISQIKQHTFWWSPCLNRSGLFWQQKNICCVFSALSQLQIGFKTFANCCILFHNFHRVTTLLAKSLCLPTQHTQNRSQQQGLKNISEPHFSFGRVWGNTVYQAHTYVFLLACG